MKAIQEFDEAWIPPNLLGAARSITRRLAGRGYAAYFAGGCVRDVLLRRPVQDIDIATAAPPEEVQRLFSSTIPVGAHFGVVIVRQDEHQFEVATFRTDLSYSDGRRPDAVRFASAEEDARRRDFTVNGLFYDPAQGRVIDFIGGREDLAAGIIRAIGVAAERFREDRLRLLRSVRFAAALGFEIQADTWTALVELAPFITEVSAERIRDELLKTLTSSGAGRALDLLTKSGLLGVVLPEVAAMAGVPQPPEFHPEGDVLTHTHLMFEQARFPLSDTLAMGILLHDVGKPPTYRLAERIRFDQHDQIGAAMAQRILARLKFSREQVKLSTELVKRHLQFMNVPKMRESTLKKFLRMENFAEHLELHRLDCLASHGKLENWDFCRHKLEELGAEKIRPMPLINGQDLIDLGLAPGPIFRRILEEVENLQLENQLESKEAALIYVRATYMN